jgi:hypothetical protein
MSLTAGPFSFMHGLLGTSLGRIVEAPGVWLTSFLDDADDIWASDPLLSDDDDAWLP